MLLGVVACSSDNTSPNSSTTGHTSKYPTCKQIVETCHPFDVGKGPIHDCHDLGHAAKSDAECIPKKEECLRICVPSPEDDGGTDAGADDASDGGQP